MAKRKAAADVGGRPAIFKTGSDRVRFQGFLSSEAAEMLERARFGLLELYRSVRGVDEAARVTASDAAVFEYLLRGQRGTREYLRQQAGKR